ncbi:MAG: 3-keto-disaccharide hydrolase [Pirellulales bacterium]
MSGRQFCTFLAVTVFLACGALAGAAEQGGWVSLFNGKDLDGWTQINGLAKYEAKDGTILGSSVPNSPNSFLCTKKNYGDFELQFDVKCDARLNSGVQIRSESKKEYQNGRVHGYQVEIAVGGFSGGIYDEARRGKFLNADTPTKKDASEEARKHLKKDEWNHYRVVCRGDRIRTWVNDVKVTDLRDDMTKSGFIGLQVHGVGDLAEPLKVQWRNIRLRELSAKGAKAKAPKA